MKEHGICAKCKKSVGCPYANDRITGCKNFVLEPELKLTNEESLRQYNTEQLADVFYMVFHNHADRVLNAFWDKHKDVFKKDMMEWLKQPHKE